MITFIWLLIFYGDSWHLIHFSSFSLLTFEISAFHLLTTSDYLRGTSDYLDSSFFLFFLRFYLYIHERHREKEEGGEAETQAEGEAGSM